MDIVQTHRHPVTAVKYSHCFRQVITSCEGAVSLMGCMGSHVKQSSIAETMSLYLANLFHFYKVPMKMLLYMLTGGEGVGHINWKECV